MVVISCYFLVEVEFIVIFYDVWVIFVDIYDYSKELELVKVLLENFCLGIVSFSFGIFIIVEIFIYSLWGEFFFLKLVLVSDFQKLCFLVCIVCIIIIDFVSEFIVCQAIEVECYDLIWMLEIICFEYYIGEKFIVIFKWELGLGEEEMEEEGKLIKVVMV